MGNEEMNEGMKKMKKEVSKIKGARKRVDWQVPEIPRVIGVGLMKGDFGKSFMEEFEGRVLKDYAEYGGYRSLIGVLRPDKEGFVRGSGCFANVLANQILREEKLRTPTPRDAEIIFQRGGIFDSERDFAQIGTALIVNYDSSNEKEEFMPSLIEQLKARAVDFGKSIIIPYNGFDLINEKNEDGLGLKVRDDAEIFELDLGAIDYGKFSQVDPKTGFPIDVKPRIPGNGDREYHCSKEPIIKGLELDEKGAFSAYSFYINFWGIYRFHTFLPLVYDLSDSVGGGRTFYRELARLQGLQAKRKGAVVEETCSDESCVGLEEGA